MLDSIYHMTLRFLCIMFNECLINVAHIKMVT